MKLTLKNFRCYTNQTFEFDDDTITLISGPSGQGKTTILLGIQFALYGSLKHRYLISHNKNSCEVTLEYKNFKITRTKRPNILNVEYNGRFYEDKEAQVVLNKYFGVTNSSIFFMDLSHLEKMEFLEKIINTNCDIKDLKNRIKIELTNLNKELAILDGQISNTESMLEIIQKPKKVDKPLVEDFFDSEDLLNLSVEDLCLKKDSIIKNIEKEKIIKMKHNNLMVEFSVLQDEICSLGYIDHTLDQQIETLSTNLIELKSQHNHWNHVRDNFLMAEESLKELKNYTHINIDIVHDLTKRIEMIEDDIKRCIQFKDLQTFNKFKNEYEQGLYEENLNWQKQVNLLQNQLMEINIDKTSLKKLSELERIYAKFESVTTFNLAHNIDDIQDQIQTLKSKFFKSYNCTNCNHRLVINMDTLEMVQDSSNFQESGNIGFNNTIKNQLKKLEILKDKITCNNEFIQGTDIEDIKVKITLIKKYQAIENKIKQFDTFKPSISLINMEKQIIKLRRSLSLESLESDTEVKVVEKDLETLKDEKRDLTIQLNTVSQQLKIKNNLLNKIYLKETYDQVEHKRVIDLIDVYSEELTNKSVEFEKLKTNERLQAKLESLKIEIDNLGFMDQTIPCLEKLLEKINSGLKYHEKMTEYNSFHIQFKKYKKVKQTLNNFILSKESTERTYLKTLVFKQKVIEAEHESLQFMVNIINTHLSILLQDFFSEGFGDPIQIYLELISDKRPQVNTVINYKGNKVDYKSLSTGEYARVKLAFDLTFKEILGENIIMLDECTANLDQDLSTKIFNRIKATFPSKTILVVAHQVVKGTFDNVLNLSS